MPGLTFLTLQHYVITLNVCLTIFRQNGKQHFSKVSLKLTYLTFLCGFDYLQVLINSTWCCSKIFKSNIPFRISNELPVHYTVYTLHFKILNFFVLCFIGCRGFEGQGHVQPNMGNPTWIKGSF